MSLNRTRIEWTTRTWNPISGCWGPEGSGERPNWCSYCYARKIAERFKGTPAFPRGFEPTFHPDRLVDPYKLKEPSKIFTCSMSDMFGPWLSENWIGEVLCNIGNNLKHTFQVLTKSPQNLMNWQRFFPSNLWLGVSVTVQEDIERITYLKIVEPNIRFVSFEPLLGLIKANLEGIDWVIIGGQTNPTRLPKKEWVDILIDQAKDLAIPIFLKNNLGWPERIREYPGHKS